MFQVEAIAEDDNWLKIKKTLKEDEEHFLSRIYLSKHWEKIVLGLKLLDFYLLNCYVCYGHKLCNIAETKEAGDFRKGDMRAIGVSGFSRVVSGFS